MSGALPEEHVRAAAIQWLSEVTFDGTVPVTRDQLSNDFHVGGSRFPLVDAGRGIRRPAGWSTALSVLTAVPKGSRVPSTTTRRGRTAITGTSSAATHGARPRTRASGRR